MRGSRSDARLRQLCREVERTLGASLASLDDLALSTLIVDTVVPYPDAARLLVVVCPSLEDPLVPELLLERLARAKGYLRADLASAINRKRTPELFFQIGSPAPPRVTS